MREIKFRAWNPEIKRMSNPFGFNHVMDFTNAEGLGYVKTITNEVLMQYTGLHDKHGKEIYEGDILKYTYESDLSPEYFPVIFYNGSFSAGYNESLENGYLGDDLQMTFWTIEIVGNIYQNPDLCQQN